MRPCCGVTPGSLACPCQGGWEQRVGGKVNHCVHLSNTSMIAIEQLLQKVSPSVQ